MPVILRNDDAEALILDIRAGRNAVRQDLGGRAGGFLIFPTSVVTGGRSGAQLVYPLTTDSEPGCLVAAAGTAHIAGVVAGVRVSGSFHWTVGGGDPEPARYQFHGRGRAVPAPPWAGQLPQSQVVGCTAGAALSRQRMGMRRRGRVAEHWLLTLTEQVIRQACRGPLGRAINFRPVVDVDDVVQRGLQTAARLLPRYASKDRPPCSWLGMLHLDCRRDMRREVSRLDWLPVEAVAAVTLAHACGIHLHADPSATLAALVEEAERLGHPRPRIAAPQLDAALRAPAFMAQEAEACAAVAAAEPGTNEDGEVAAHVARLVSDDDDFVARAAANDPLALSQVGDQILRRLRDRCESPPAARRRCWEQFQQSGQLFTTPAGLTRFADVADPLRLAALDECLRRAAGIVRSPGDR